VRTLIHDSSEQVADAHRRVHEVSGARSPKMKIRRLPPQPERLHFAKCTQAEVGYPALHL
jgi:hypothetical protein